MKDEVYMKRALELALKGEGKVNPNPLVGAVIVKDGRIIGEGYHERFGGNHAEINAFKNATESVEGATLYVNLEPCCHYGKTPPCVESILAKKISKVVVGMEDPNEKVAGKGISILREKGLEVKVGVLKEKCIKLNEIFIKYIVKKEPFVILKWAMTLDGKLATYKGDSKWISNEVSREYVHHIRNRVSGIMVGVNTVLKDNPYLTTRIGEGGSDAIPIILDSKGRIDLQANLFKGNNSPIIALTEEAKEERVEEIKKSGAEIIITPSREGKVDMNYLIKKLGERNLDSILVEGGGEVAFSALKEKVVDKVLCFIAPKIVGGKDAKSPVAGMGFPYINDSIKLRNLSFKSIKEDLCIEGYVDYERK